METFGIHMAVLLPAILFAHFIMLFVDDSSKHQKKKLCKSIERILANLNLKQQEGEKYPTFDFIYKRRNFKIGVYKQEHNYRYTTYHIYINGDDAGIYHRIGDCCTNEYYFETQNHREKLEVIEIVNAAAKQLKREMKKNSRAVSDTLTSCNNYSYFK